jgi:hypothetical protein
MFGGEMLLKVACQGRYGYADCLLLLRRDIA